MAQGASTPIEVRVAGKNFDELKSYATKLVDSLKKISLPAGCTNSATIKFPNY